jgi:hypothetical protein
MRNRTIQRLVAHHPNRHRLIGFAAGMRIKVQSLPGLP